MDFTPKYLEQILNNSKKLYFNFNSLEYFIVYVQLCQIKIYKIFLELYIFNFWPSYP